MTILVRMLHSQVEKILVRRLRTESPFEGAFQSSDVHRVEFLGKYACTLEGLERSWTVNDLGPTLALRRLVDVYILKCDSVGLLILQQYRKSLEPISLLTKTVITTPPSKEIGHQS